MNENLKFFLERAQNFYAGLSPIKRTSLIVGGTLVLLAIIAVVAMPKNETFEVLYKDLSEESTASISQKLSEMNIPFEVSENRSIVYVPTGQVHELRMKLAQEGLPGEDIVGFESFDTFNFGTSSYVQRIQYIRAVQGELTRSIQRIEAVKRARVHISVPPKKVFLEEQDPPKASVVIEFHPNKTLSQSEIKGIAHIVSSAIEGLSSDAVTIVDSRGNFLLKPNEDKDLLVSNKLLELQRSIEKSYQKRIEDLLVPVVGAGKIIAKVTAEIENTRMDSTSESFDSENAVPNSVVKNDEITSGSRPNPIGIPGSRTNLPGSEVDNPPVLNATSNTERNTSTTNFSVPRKVETVSKPSGAIKRLTVAVLVDGLYSADPNTPGKKVYQPRSEEELQRIQEIVSNAVGFDVSRRDSVSVKNMQFSTNEYELEPELEKAFDWKSFVEEALKNGLIALVIILFFLLVLRPFLRWLTLSEVEKEMALLPKTLEEIESVQRMDDGVLALTKEVPQLEEAEDLEKKEQTDLLKNIEEILESSPKKGLRIIQEWMEQSKFAQEPVA